MSDSGCLSPSGLILTLLFIRFPVEVLLDTLPKCSFPGRFLAFFSVLRAVKKGKSIPVCRTVWKGSCAPSDGVLFRASSAMAVLHRYCEPHRHLGSLKLVRQRFPGRLDSRRKALYYYRQERGNYNSC